jgi:hypothetical protein
MLVLLQQWRLGYITATVLVNEDGRILFVDNVCLYGCPEVRGEHTFLQNLDPVALV